MRPLLLALALLQASCFCSSYLWQAAGGQVDLWRRARPIPTVLADPKSPPRVNGLLARIGEIKRFGEAHGLTPTANYTDYADLERPAAVWVVSACAPLKFESRSWWFPIVGRFPYLGWFDERRAESFAAKLRGEPEHWDVDVRPASAYSTLGWFKDPVLSTMIPPGEEALGELADTVLHESVHATLHVSGQAWFNESLASWVADRLTPEWLRSALGADAPELAAWNASQQRGNEVVERLHRAYGELEAIYDSPRSDAEKQAAKAQVLETAGRDISARRALNNATLVQFATYFTGAAEFSALFEACGRDWPRFWHALAGLDEVARGRPLHDDLGPVLHELAAARCGGN